MTEPATKPDHDSLDQWGQAILPKANHDRRDWDAGVWLLVKETAEGALPKRAPAFAATRPDEVFTMPPEQGASRSVEKMEAAVLAEARRHARDRRQCGRSAT